MKLTQSMLRTIIKEELKRVLKESDGYEIFKQEPPTGKTSLSNDELAALAVIGELISNYIPTTKNAITGLYSKITKKSPLTTNLDNLLNKNLIQFDKDEKLYYITDTGDEELRNVGNHPVKNLVKGLLGL